VFFSERSLHADSERAIRNAINDLTFKGHVYKGKLPPPKGQLPEDWEDREQTCSAPPRLATTLTVR
jgi:arginyl-tRNA synthetase